MTIFGAPWDDLAVEHVQAFLDDADDEPYLWEAKGGGERPHTRSVRKAVCGFANSRGGWLILGADRDAQGTWTLDGVDFRNEEPRTWVDSVVRDGMSPVPDHDTKPLAVSDGRHVAVVRIEPVGQPPCITRDGIIWQRVSGRTVPVTDPLVLARLTSQGERARDQAIELAKDAIDQSLDSNNAFVYQPSTFIFAIALASVTYAPRIEQRLYTASTKEHLGERFRARLKPDRHRHFAGGPRYRVHWDGVTAVMSGERFDARWTVTLHRTGAVAVTCTLDKPADDQVLGIELLMEDVVQPAWAVASDFVATLGGSGRTALWMRTRARIMLAHREETLELGESVLAEWTSDVTPTEDDVAYIRRQLLRSAGFEEWEPDGGNG